MATRVGLISDTHGRLRPDAFEHFAGVDRILHAGDIGSLDLLADLEAIAPVTAVSGNTDGFEIRARVPEEAALELEGRRIIVVHGHRLISPNPRLLREAYPDADIVVFGHTHRPLVNRSARPFVINPGAAGPPRFGLRPSVALLTIDRRGIDIQPIELAD